MSSCATGTFGTAFSHTSEATAPASTSTVGHGTLNPEPGLHPPGKGGWHWQR
ncbi:MAG: hypothetical protein H5U26_02040 [Immundisolibacter sp.]|uniref:hypothetical protein n=1 Tax=Immundisolibacter sp. TaxID=1934948 RepID=UPI00198B8876|nr:hypothetical protein [Immundisolibacter sp.]MBC7160876.1 hypothetical protein [Immundisolibacter sp.]